MAATQPTRNHSFHLGRALVIVGVALALAVGAFAAGAVASLGAVAVFSRTSTAPPSPVVQPVGSAVAASPSASAPTPTTAPTPTPDPRQTGKTIAVSIAQQRLTAYEDGAVVLTTNVATGRPALPTVTGTFHIISKSSPYKFVSPWPRGNPYWYPDEWVSYAMLFADDGYFIHDAPWRTVYGPGANLTQGTHGCVNVPTATMAALYRWADAGTTVIVE